MLDVGAQPLLEVLILLALGDACADCGADDVCGGRGNWTLAASELMNVVSRPSHGQMISWEEAASPKLGLAVEHMDAAPIVPSPGRFVGRMSLVRQ